MSASRGAESQSVQRGNAITTWCTHNGIKDAQYAVIQVRPTLSRRPLQVLDTCGADDPI